MSYLTLTLSERFDGQLLEVTLASPPANILTAAMMQELRKLLAAERAPSRRKGIVIRGAGAHFCYGASVAEHTADEVGQMLPVFHALIGELLEHPVATVAQVSGRCLGGGFELALACTFLFADDTARFAVPEITLGVFPPVAAVLLPQMTGAALAARLVLAAETVDAAALEQFGLVTGRTAPDGLKAAIDAYFAKNLQPRSASSLRCAHRVTRATVAGHYRARIGAAEALYLDELMATGDANEGITAFLARRAPQWRDA
ncbi:MAG: cyclohexa-1,5-dienecarbonyl-CoA hydratase [Gammaproteobacteria bacterium]|nr:cyclohexa-1,5-dienecarbonyl-CoA hydratase [Gammaproteobacteria bacterium]